MSNASRRSVRPKQPPRYLGDYVVDLPTAGDGTDMPTAGDESDVRNTVDGTDMPSAGAESNMPVPGAGLAVDIEKVDSDTVLQKTGGLTSFSRTGDTVIKCDGTVFSSVVTNKTETTSPLLVKCDSLVRRLEVHMLKAREMMTSKASRSVLQSLMKRMEHEADEFKKIIDCLEPMLSSGDQIKVHRWYFSWLDGFDEVQDEVTIHLDLREEEPVSYAGSIAPTYASSHCSEGDERDNSLAGSSSGKELSRLEQLEIDTEVAARKLEQERLRVLEEEDIRKRQENLRLLREQDAIEQKRLEIRLNKLCLPASEPRLPSLPPRIPADLQQPAYIPSGLSRVPAGMPSGASQAHPPLQGALPFASPYRRGPAVTHDQAPQLQQHSGSQPLTTLPSEDYHHLFKHLAKPSLDIFYGESEKYFQWREQFKLFVDETSVPAHVKMMLLKKCLKGRPLQMIVNLGYTNAQYSLALRRLDQRFGGAKRAIQRHLREIFETDKVRENDLSSLENFVDCIQNIEASLLEQGHVSELSSASALYSAVLMKLPEELVLKYRMWTDDGRSDTLSELIVWLQKYVTMKAEAIEVTRSSKPDKTSTAKKSARSHASVTSSSDQTSTQRSGEKISHSRKESLRAKPTNQKQKGQGTVKNAQSASTGSRFSSQRKTNSASDVEENSQCVICENTHPLSNCSRWKAMTVAARWHAARAYNVCFRCLSGGHRGQSCKHNNLCGVDSCPQTHHRDLHYVPKKDSTQVSTPQAASTSTPQAASTSTPQAASTSTQRVISSSAARQSKAPRSVALRVLPVYVVGRKGKFLVNAFLDDGSDTSFIRKEIADALGCKFNEEQLSLSTLVENTNVKTSTVELGIENLNGDLSRNLRVKVLPKICPAVAVVDWNRHRKAWAHLKDLEFPKLPGTRTIDILLGSDYPELSLSLKERFGQPGEPVARLTPLGWTCIGRVSSLGSSAVSCHAIVDDGTSEDLTTLLRRSWELDTLGIRKVSDTVSLVDRMVLEEAEKGRRLVGDRYQVSIPWKQGQPSLPDNRSEAVKRLISLEKSLHRRGSDICTRYQEAMQDYFKKGYFEQLQDPSPGGWYLPHFAVVREDKTSTKLRIVFDGSSRFHGTSLNDSMHAGPKLQNDILSVLVRFRFRSIAVVGDIKEMFSQIVMNPPDRNYHRILWRNLDPKQPIQTYEAARLPFGDRASPFLAQFVVKRHAEDNSKLFPVGSLTCLQDMYVDDVITGASSVEAAIETRREVSKLLGSAGFVVRKWCSNNIEVVQDVPPEDRASGLELYDSAGSLPSLKTLGVTWNVGNDNFSFQVRCSPAVFTKRSLLSRIATIFDPLQFLAPFLIRARIIMQETWFRGLDWDEPLPNDLQTSMREWIEELAEVPSLYIPRFLCEVSTNTIFHTFVDASSLAFAAATYVADSGQSLNSKRLVAAKAHVAPLSATSIPRLELTAALIGLRLSVAIAKALGVRMNRFIFWTDSVNVLHWIHNHSRSFKPFVAHRIAEIQEHSEPNQWKYVPTTLNIADLATRGVKMEQLRQTAWLSGPEFISRHRNEWPSQPRISSSEETETELRTTTGTVHMTSVSVSDQTLSQADSFLDVTLFSSWTRLLQRTAYVLRFIRNSRSLPEDRITSKYLQVPEWNAAERVLVILAQRDGFAHTLAQLKKGKSLPPSSPLSKLSPFQCDGVLRVGGRLQHATLPYEVKHPMLLPRKHHVTELVIRFYHAQGLHVRGVNGTLADIRQRFWIIRGREAIKAWERQCQECKRRRSIPAQQIMAPLPAARVNFTRAFHSIGVDFAGPFITKITRNVSAKRYLCLFTCLQIRAVHCEMVYSLDAAGFLQAFSRFVARRGRPEFVVSDNGRNFVAAEKELKEVFRGLDKSVIAENMATNRIEWQFRPPFAPHQTGIVEAMVKSVKRAVYSSLAYRKLSDEELHTAFVEVEGMLNSRPLSYTSSDKKDLLPLTPNDFLFGMAVSPLADPSSGQCHSLRNRWKLVQELVQQVWRRWQREYLTEQQVRKKWTTEEKDFQVGAVVIVREDNTPRNVWQLGRITEIHSGSDGHVRSAKVFTQGKEYIRPITRLVPLEMSEPSVFTEGSVPAKA